MGLGDDEKLTLNELDENDLPASIIMPTEYDKEKDLENRKNNLKTKCSNENKIYFYNAGVKGDLELLKTGLEKGVPISEECSAASYYWTCLHYSAFYGHTNIVEYILDLCKDDEDYLGKCNIQCNKGKTPVMWALSNAPKDKKKELLLLFQQKGAIDYNCCDYENKNVYHYIDTNLPEFKKEFLLLVINGS